MKRIANPIVPALGEGRTPSSKAYDGRHGVSRRVSGLRENRLHRERNGPFLRRLAGHRRGRQPA